MKAKLEEDKTVSVGLDLPKSSRSIPLDESFQSFIGDIQHELPSHLSKQKKRKISFYYIPSESLYSNLAQSRPQKWKTAFRGPSGKLAVLRPSGIASNLETSRHKLVQCFKAHNDVVWDVTAFQIGASGKHLVASASAGISNFYNNSLSKKKLY